MRKVDRWRGGFERTRGGDVIVVVVKEGGGGGEDDVM